MNFLGQGETLVAEAPVQCRTDVFDQGSAYVFVRSGSSDSTTQRTPRRKSVANAARPYS